MTDDNFDKIREYLSYRENKIVSEIHFVEISMPISPPIYYLFHHINNKIYTMSRIEFDNININIRKLKIKKIIKL